MNDKFENSLGGLLPSALTAVTLVLALASSEASPFYKTEIVSQSGGAQGFTSFGAAPSINDNGYVAFVGRYPHGDGRTDENVYAYNSQSKSLQPLLNPYFVIPTTPATTNTPSQSFSPFVQVNNQNQVIARRWVNAVAQLWSWLIPLPPMPYGGLQIFPLSYLESWPVTGNNGVAGHVGLPDKTYVMGDGGYGPICTLPYEWMGVDIWPAGWFYTGTCGNFNLATYYFMNPVTAGIYPSAYDQSGQFMSVNYATMNNLGQEVFVGFRQDGTMCIGTEPTPKGFYYATVPWFPRPVIADDGYFTCRMGTADSAVIKRYPYNWGADRTVIADSSMGFSSWGLPGVSDDGKVVAFYGRLDNDQIATAPTFGLGTGPGIFVSLNTGGGSWILRRVAGLTQGGMPADLGTNSVSGLPVGFATFESEVRTCVLHRESGAAGIQDDPVVVCFIATPNTTASTLPGDYQLDVRGTRGVWTVRGTLRQSPALTNQLIFQRDEILPVVQGGESLGSGGTWPITDVAINDSLAFFPGTPASDSLRQHNVALWAASGNNVPLHGNLGECYPDNSGEGGTGYRAKLGAS